MAFILLIRLGLLESTRSYDPQSIDRIASEFAHIYESLLFHEHVKRKLADPDFPDRELLAATHIRIEDALGRPLH